MAELYNMVYMYYSGGEICGCRVVIHGSATLTTSKSTERSSESLGPGRQAGRQAGDWIDLNLVPPPGEKVL